MRKVLAIALLAAGLAGCATGERDRNILAGAGLGAGVGALIGSASGGPPAAWLGAAVGGAAGGFIGYMIWPDGCFYRNRRGELWQVDCGDHFVRGPACYIGPDPWRMHEVPCPPRNRFARGA
jgi:hypothetical protein